MPIPLKPTDFLFGGESSRSRPSFSFSRPSETSSSISNNFNDNQLTSVQSAPPQNIFVSKDEVIFNENSNDNHDSEINGIPVPSIENNILLPKFPDTPVIETTSFKAYLVLAEENIFLQNEAAGSSRTLRRRGQRRDLLAASANGGSSPGHSHNEISLENTNPRNTVLEDSESNNTHDEHNTSANTNENESDSVDDDEDELPPTLLRGILVFRVLKPNTKVKHINLNFRGDSRTNWPEGIPPKKTEFVETQPILNNQWNFFNQQDHNVPKYSKGGADHINTLPDYILNNNKVDSLELDNLDLNDTVSNLFSSLSAIPSNSSQKSSIKSRIFGKPKNVFAKATKKSLDRLSIDVDSSKSVGLEPVNSATTFDGKSIYFDSSGNYVFQPGDYIYNFEYEIPQSSPESLSLTFGFVNYWLNLEVGRSGKFKSALRAKKKINLIRTNSSQSIEENFDPIMITKTWEDRLSYSILIASNFVILNSFMPINIRLVPTDKNVKLYKIKIFIVEILEYWCKSRKVHRLEPQRKFLLLEHKPKVGTNLLRDFEDIKFDNSVISDKTENSKNKKSQASSLNVNDGPSLYSNDRSSNNSTTNTAATPINHSTPSTPTINHNGGNSLKKSDSLNKKKGKKAKKAIEDDENEYISSKDFNYQLYIPETFSKFSSKLHPDAKHKNIQCHHWIKISLRLSKKVDDFDIVDDSQQASSTNNTNTNGEVDNHEHHHRSSFAGIPKMRTRSNSNNGQNDKVPEEKPKRKHYEISIDSPINLLHPLCTQANTLLPAYDGVGLYDPYTYARKKESGEIEILTNNKPLFPPESLVTDASEANVNNTNILTTDDAIEDLSKLNPLDIHRKPAISTAIKDPLPYDHVLGKKPMLADESSDDEDSKPFMTGENYETLDHEFTGEVTADMTSANLYSPGAVDLDLVSAQAQPMNPNIPSVAMSPTNSMAPNENIDFLLSPNVKPVDPNSLQVSPINANQLSPNFRALSPTLQALSPTLNGTPIKSSASSIKSPLLVATTSATNMGHSNSVFSNANTINDTSMHLLVKPPMKPPTYKQSIGEVPLDHNLKIPNLLLLDNDEAIKGPPPPAYEQAIKPNDMRNLRKWQRIEDEDIDTDGDDIAENFSFRGEDPNLPNSIIRAASPKITATSIYNDDSNQYLDITSALLNHNESGSIIDDVSDIELENNNHNNNNIDNVPKNFIIENADNDESEERLRSGSFASLPSEFSAVTSFEGIPNAIDKFPLLNAEESTTSLLNKAPSRISTALNNSSLTSLWSPMKLNNGIKNPLSKLKFNNLKDKQNGNRSKPDLLDIDNDSSNDLGLL